MVFEDKSFVVTRWYRSVWVFALVLVIVFLPNDYPIKWFLMFVVFLFAGLSREVCLNDKTGSIDRRLSFFGIKRRIGVFPESEIERIFVRQDPSNRYELVVLSKSGSQSVLLVEDLKVDIDRTVGLVQDFLDRGMADSKRGV